MPTFSRSLEQSLHRALALANERHHEYATLEHLLLALMDDADAGQVMKACNVDIEALRRAVLKYVDEELVTLVIEDGRISLDLRIDLPRPRERGSADVAALEGRILRELFKNARAGDDA